jgi:hypothetical protein
MGVGHRGTAIFMTEEFLDGPDVVAGLKQMSGKGMEDGFMRRPNWVWLVSAQRMRGEFSAWLPVL